MSVDLLHDKIRKIKNPSMVNLSYVPDYIPAHVTEQEGSEANFCAFHKLFSVI